MVHYGFVAGALLPVNLASLHPLMEKLPSFPTVHAVAYTADSRFAVINQAVAMTVLSTNTVGKAAIPEGAIDLGQFSGKNTGTSTGSAGKGCATFSLTGSWQYTDPRVAGSLTATLYQSGTTLRGTMVDWGGNKWSVQGAVQGVRITLRFLPPGPGYASLDGTFQGTLSSDGQTIAGQAVYEGTSVTHITLTGNACSS